MIHSAATSSGATKIPRCEGNCIFHFRFLLEWEKLVCEASAEKKGNTHTVWITAHLLKTQHAMHTKNQMNELSDCFFNMAATH